MCVSGSTRMSQIYNSKKIEHMYWPNKLTVRV